MVSDEPQARAEFLVPQIDIEGVLSFIKEIKVGVHDALPELSSTNSAKLDRSLRRPLNRKLIEFVIKAIDAPEL